MPTSFLLLQPQMWSGEADHGHCLVVGVHLFQHGVPWWHPGTLKGNLKAPIVDRLLASLGVVTASFLPLPGLDSHWMWGILYISIRQNRSNIFSFDTGFLSFTNPRKPTFIRPFQSTLNLLCQLRGSQCKIFLVSPSGQLLRGEAKWHLELKLATVPGPRSW